MSRQRLTMRRLLGLAALVVASGAVAIPAHAGLDDLAEGLLDEVTETLPLSEVVMAPIVVDPPTVSTPEVVVTDDVVVDPIVIAPPSVTVDPGADESKPPIVGTEPDDRPPLNSEPEIGPAPETLPLRPNLVPAVGGLVPPASDRSLRSSNVDLELARTIAPVVASNRVEAVPLAVPPSSWLTALTDWLSFDAYADILAIPVHLVGLLLRALTTAGSGLVAPTAILIAVLVGSRRRHVATR